ncbi:LAFE_0A04126g1_1 [Lachancea fermentati]|uniref:Glutaredoxin-like protein n=1 Tax=Lachancea fermentati TaxID=4955 RepID=A0A1G4M6M5_LACFM|nr:LAFE_0A04126g1_1 [Lachancea fermentati]
MLRRLGVRGFRTGCRLSNYSNVRLTLFSKNNCGLCHKADNVVKQVMKGSGYDELSYHIVDIDEPGNKKWWELYCMDVPVLHVENTLKPDSLVKIFHRLDELDVKEKINAAK